MTWESETRIFLFCDHTPRYGNSTFEGGIVNVKRLSQGRTVSGWGFICLQNFPHLFLPSPLYVPIHSYITVLQVLLKLRTSMASLGLSHVSQHFPGQLMKEKVVNK